MKRDIPFDLPAGATAELECDLEIVRAGHFESQMHIYLDDFGVRELIVWVHGRVAAE